jgi:hypothetical protein
MRDCFVEFPLSLAYDAESFSTDRVIGLFLED